jgi:hypothetical protein
MQRLAEKSGKWKSRFLTPLKNASGARNSKFWDLARVVKTDPRAQSRATVRLVTANGLDYLGGLALK